MRRGVPDSCARAPTRRRPIIGKAEINRDWCLAAKGMGCHECVDVCNYEALELGADNDAGGGRGCVQRLRAPASWRASRCRQVPSRPAPPIAPSSSVRPKKWRRDQDEEAKTYRLRFLIMLALAGRGGRGVHFTAGGIGNFCGIGFESHAAVPPRRAAGHDRRRTAIPMAVISVAVVLLVSYRAKARCSAPARARALPCREGRRG